MKDNDIAFEFKKLFKKIVDINNTNDLQKNIFHNKMLISHINLQCLIQNKQDTYVEFINPKKYCSFVLDKCK